MSVDLAPITGTGRHCGTVQTVVGPRSAVLVWTCPRCSFRTAHLEMNSWPESVKVRRWVLWGKRIDRHHDTH